ncbi:hypothetical protein PLICRDRAFT_100040 [Plicaturopsis crispa FD-325 SS-3]|nr:hypothetical protein PLICRDRAFT_100040 [Plicaturopsis crispa FD-325 SS-3]
MEHDGESDDDAEGEVDLPEDRTRQAHYRDDSRGGSEYDLRRRTTSGPTPSAQRPVRSSPRTTRYSPYSENTRNSSVPPPRRVRQTNVLPVPVPVPNLTKKSRGRHVPTELADAVDGDAGWRGARAYTCVVAGCGKCFARGEHLKRHVRSIHTYEKPHKCPFPGCGKEFSRHDNLGQHMRVHKNHSAPRDGLALHFDERAGGA